LPRFSRDGVESPGAMTDHVVDSDLLPPDHRPGARGRDCSRESGYRSGRRVRAS
jgi:hypothetical protein